jgi:peptidyl-dipeptidase Dcp
MKYTSLYSKLKLLTFPLTILPLAALTMAANAADNPLLRKWSGPYGGLPPFDKMKVSDVKPALEEAMARKRAEMHKIADNA